MTRWTAARPSPAWWSPDHPIGQLLLHGRARFDLARWTPGNAADRELKRVIARLARYHTMISIPRLRRLAAQAATIHHDRVPGAIVECGTWRGGSLALIDWVLRSAGDARELWAFDSFEGLPAPGPHDGADVHRAFFRGWCTASPDSVRDALRMVGGPADVLHIVPGWLNQTLRRATSGPIALLHVDVDWYDSVTTVLDTLFDCVSPRGIIQIDDYGRWQGCDAAVHDFLARRGLPRDLVQRDALRHGAWIRIRSR